MIAAGFGMIIYAYPIVRTFGHMDWAEKYLGAAGSYTAWKLIGFAFILLSFRVLVNGSIF
jgi:hypothetical protein